LIEKLAFLSETLSLIEKLISLLESFTFSLKNWLFFWILLPFVGKPASPLETLYPSLKKNWLLL
jgi:hypothetical protein